MEILERAIEHANKRNGQIEYSAFKEAVYVKHLDGSQFQFNSAGMEIFEERMLIVYSEHNIPMVFFKEDLEEYRETERSETKKSNWGVAQW